MEGTGIKCENAMNILAPTVLCYTQPSSRLLQKTSDGAQVIDGSKS
jgi:hypothetical protein